jgi:hypothetical protein
MRDVIGATVHTLGYLLLTGSAALLLIRYVP